MKVAELNTFCRCYDLVFVENITREHRTAYTFLDFENHRHTYFYEEIVDKLREKHCEILSD